MPKARETVRPWSSTRIARHTSGARANALDPETAGGPRLLLRRVMKDVGEKPMEKEWPRGQTLDESHGGAAARAWPCCP
jgi:hypothetical protein